MRKKKPPKESKRPWTAWTKLLVNGEMLDRLRYRPGINDPEFCDGCEIQKGCYHRLGCSKERSVCSLHEFFIDCDCNVRKDESV